MNNAILILLSCGAGDYINKGVLIGFYFVFVYQAVTRRRILLNAIGSAAFWILAFFGLYFTIVGFESLSDLKRFFIAPAFLYLSGWVLTEAHGGAQNPEIAIGNIQKIVLSIMIGYSIHALLNYSVNIGRERWLLIDYFSGSLRAATGLGMINTVAFSTFLYCFMEKNIKKKTVAGGCVIIAIVYGLQVGSRTQLLILVAVTMACLLFYFHEVDNAKGIRITLLTILALCVAAVVVINTDFMGLRTKIEMSNLFYRVNADTSYGDGVRAERLIQGLQSLLDYPLGNQAQLYFHNMWLDAGRVAGTVAFLLIVVYSLITYRHVWLIACNKNIALSFRLMLFGIYLGLLMNYFVEPVLEGMTEHFYVFCLINGATECLFTCIRREMQSESKT